MARIERRRGGNFAGRVAPMRQVNVDWRLRQLKRYADAAGKVRADDGGTPLFGAAHDLDMGIAQGLAECHQLTGMHIQIIEQAG